MPQVNEQLIRQVFGEMVKYRPALSKFSVADDDDEAEADFRILGDQIIKNFPWPIGIELRRLFSAGMRELNRMRLDQIFKTIERTMQFLSFVMLSQVWNDIIVKKISLDARLGRELSDRLQMLTMGNFTWMIRALGQLYKEADGQWFMTEMSDKLDKNLFSELDFWVPERNEIGHYQINLNQEEIEKRCVEYEEKLCFILKQIAFLAKYRLVSVREIKVQKPKFKSARFQHVVDLLNSSDSDFAAREIEEEAFSESHSILLVRSVKRIEEYLNLSPLVIDTHSEVLDTKEKFGIKKDVFMYTKRRGDNLMYLGTEVTEKCDLRSLSNYSQLVDEFNALLTAISPTA